LYRLGRYGNGASLEDIARVAGFSEGSVEAFTDRVFTAIEDLHDLFVRPLTPEEKEAEKVWMDNHLGFKGLWREAGSCTMELLLFSMQNLGWSRILNQESELRDGFRRFGVAIVVPISSRFEFLRGCFFQICVHLLSIRNQNIGEHTSWSTICRNLEDGGRVRDVERSFGKAIDSQRILRQGCPFRI
jgi:hypothetical protein